MTRFIFSLPAIEMKSRVQAAGKESELQGACKIIDLDEQVGGRAQPEANGRRGIERIGVILQQFELQWPGGGVRIPIPGVHRRIAPLKFQMVVREESGSAIGHGHGDGVS